MIAIVLLLFIEDFETISSLISFLCELAAEIDVQDLWEKQIREYKANNNGELNAESLKEMENLRMILLGKYFTLSKTLIFEKYVSRFSFLYA